MHGRALVHVTLRTLGLTKLAPKGFCFNQQRQSRLKRKTKQNEGKRLEKYEVPVSLPTLLSFTREVSVLRYSWQTPIWYCRRSLYITIDLPLQRGHL